jgi:hypothetical protein
MSVNVLNEGYTTKSWKDQTRTRDTGVRNALKIPVKKPLEKRSLGRLRRRWEDNVKSRFSRMGDECVSGSCPIAGFLINSVESSGSTKVSAANTHT